MSDQVRALEERMAWYERQLQELDAVVRELADEVVRLRRELDEVQQADGPQIGPANDRPPHY